MNVQREAPLPCSSLCCPLPLESIKDPNAVFAGLLTTVERMDFAASVIVVIQVSSSVATLYWHHRKLKSAPQEANTIIQRLESFYNALDSLVELLESGQAIVDPCFRTIELLHKSGQLDVFQ